MRTAVAIATVILSLGQVSRPTSALPGSGNVVPLDSVHMIDAQIGWATTYCGSCPRGTIWGLLRTTSGGTTWEDARPVDSSGRRMEVYFIYANSDFAWAQTQTGGILRTTDGGRTWKRIANPEGQTIATVTSISFINVREGWLLASLSHALGTEAVAVYWSTDGGETWTTVANSGPTGGGAGLEFTGSKTSITFFDSRRGLMTIGSLPYAFWKPYVYVTQDGGRTWRQQNLPVPPPVYTQQLQPPLPDVSSDWQSAQWPPKVFTAKDGIMRMNYQNNYTGIAQFIRPIAVFYVTHDSGATWTYTTPLPINLGTEAQPSDFADINYGWLADHNTLYATTNRGHEWTTVRTTGFPVANQLHFVSPQVGWAIRKVGWEAKPVPSLFKTVDGGRAWTPVTYTVSQR